MINLNILSTLIRHLSKMCWNEIQVQNRHKKGHEKIRGDEIKEPLPKGIKEDATLLAFRGVGMSPIVGYRDDKIFYILWIDWKFKLLRSWQLGPC